MTTGDPTLAMLLYFVMPLWLLAGIADWACHRATEIEKTSGTKESLLHLMMFVEVGIPLLAAIFLEINSLIILLMIVAFFVHEATALWDVSYAVAQREVTPIEQHIHSFLEMIPLMAMLMVISLNWQDFTALFGMADQSADFSLRWKTPPLPTGYRLTLFAAILLLVIIPYIEEFVRTLRKR